MVSLTWYTFVYKYKTSDRHEILCNGHNEGNKTTKSEQCTTDSDERTILVPTLFFAISSAVISDTPKILVSKS